MTYGDLAFTLRTALTGLNVAKNSLSVTANNVTNANTPGYSRKIAGQETYLVDGRAAGAQVLPDQRVVDDFLNTELRNQHSQFNRSTELVRIQDRIQSQLFGEPGDDSRGLTARINELAISMEALANSPETMALRSDVVASIEDLTDQLAADAKAIQDIRASIDREIKALVDSVNADIKAVEAINLEISTGTPTAELKDQRDQILQRLSGNIDISTFLHEDGEIAIYARGGQALLEYGARTLHYDPAISVAHDSPFNAIGIFHKGQLDQLTGEPKAGEIGVELVSGGIRERLTPELIADATPDSQQRISTPLEQGRIKGLLEARDKVLPELADQLQELGRMVRYQINAAHNDAVSFPQPGSLSGTRTDTTSYAGNASGKAYVALIDRSDNSSYRTIEIDLDAAATPADLATQIDTSLGTDGTATIAADGSLQISLTDQTSYGLAINKGDSQITETSAAGHSWDYGFAHYFGLNDLVVQTATTADKLAVRSDIQERTNLVSQVKLDVDLGPPLTSTSGGIGDNRGVQDLAKSLDATAQTVRRGNISADLTSIPDYMADIVSINAAQAAQVRIDKEADRSILDDLTVRQGQISGVNLDEELSRLTLYQQSYVVSARVVTVANELLEELMNIGR
ncbi:MAG: flagellar hook-associated protein FlgK [Geminicoccaceae bacterium]